MKNTFTPPTVAMRFLAPDVPICVTFPPYELLLFIEQLERDISAKALGWRPIPFTLLELLDMQSLLLQEDIKEEINRIITHSQRLLLAQYCAHYYLFAQDCENVCLAQRYDDLLTALLENATLITFSI